jgi:hypothetical protein
MVWNMQLLCRVLPEEIRSMLISALVSLGHSHAINQEKGYAKNHVVLPQWYFTHAPSVTLRSNRETAILLALVKAV